MKINRISPHNNEYLKILSNIAKPPQLLYFIGTLPESRQTSVAIVGSRKPTSYGREVTYRLAYDLAKQGIIVVSGLALGVDAIAHRAALDAGGKTIAVLANGLNEIRPATNHALGEHIIKSGGAIISEYEPNEPAMRHRFLERNRLVSGLADAIIVTEAATRSGTLSTVAHALEQGKEVFSVPGNITSPMSIGCNRIIKQGATPVTCANDILEVIAPDVINHQSILPLGRNEFETKIIKLLQSGVRDGEALQLKSGIEISQFLATMTEMELSGIVRALGCNQWTLQR